MASRDLLEKLIDVEREAEALVASAREEAGRRLDTAKTRAQADYTRAYDTALEKALSTREASEKAARDEYETAVAEYRNKLATSRLDTEAFASACEALLSEIR